MCSLQDYVKHRTDKKLSPIVFRLTEVKKVDNPFLAARFEACKYRLKAAGRDGTLRSLRDVV